MCQLKRPHLVTESFIQQVQTPLFILSLTGSDHIHFLSIFQLNQTQTGHMAITAEAGKEVCFHHKLTLLRREASMSPKKYLHTSVTLKNVWMSLN